MENSNISVIPTLPSQNSSNDNVFTDAHPTTVQTESLHLAKDMDALPSDSNSRNNLAEDRELQTATFPRINAYDMMQRGTARRESDEVEADADISENLPNETSTNRFVLRDEGNVTTENHISNDSGPVEENFHFDSGKMFEGKDLVKWLISADQDHSDEQTMIPDAKQLCLKICGRLVNAGILVPLSNTSSSKQNGFSPNLTYQWAHERKESRKIGVSEIDGPPPTDSNKIEVSEIDGPPPTDSNKIEVSETDGPPPPPPPSGGKLSIALRKDIIHPSAKMISLYWKRILISGDAATGRESPSQNSVWSEIKEDESIDMEEFTDLFSSKPIQRKDTNNDKSTKIRRINVLDNKRAKAVGILRKSLRIDFEKIKNAVYDLDTSVVKLEDIKRIYDIRPTEQELKEISDLVEEHPDIPLGDPEYFLKQLSSISQFAERVTCLLFQSKFSDAISNVSSRLTNLRSTCDVLRTSDSLKKIIGIILKLGNYMNGENETRGRADGFRLEILGNLKDYKSHIPGTTLLHFIVKRSLMQKSQQNVDDPLPLPIPEPDRIKAAATIKFADLKEELEELGKELKDCITMYEAVTAFGLENSRSFEKKMEAFTNDAVRKLRDAKTELEDSVREFKGIMQYYRCIPEGVNLDSAEPSDFFRLWEDFCNDFKNIWTEEQRNLAEQRLRENRKKRKDKGEYRKSKNDNKKSKNRLSSKWRLSGNK